MRNSFLIPIVLLVTAGAVAAAPPAVREYTLELRTVTTAPMFEMPAMPGMEDMNRPTRTIDGEAVYGERAVEPIFVTVPASLNLPGNRLNLHVSRLGPIPEYTAPPPGAAGGRMQVEMTTKTYWHPDTAAGPLVERVQADVDLSATGGPGALPSRAYARAAAESDRTASGSENVEPMGAVGAGDYVLNTGGFIMPLKGFLLPLTVSQPASLSAVPPAASILVVWNEDTAACGYILHGRGMVMNGTQVKEMVRWVSTDTVPPERVRDGYEPATTIADDVRRGILLPPGTTRCVIPPGIFANVDMLTVTLTAVGADYASDTAGCRLRGRIRSEWTATRMKGMGGMPPGMPPGMEGMPGGMPPGYPYGTMPGAYPEDGSGTGGEGQSY